MKLTTPAIAGTLESSDAQVTIEPGDGTIDRSIHSTVMAQYGRQIRETVLETMERLGVNDARVSVNDRGALDCTIRARVECAVFRACGQTENFPWGEAIRS